jgi:hypothetical protein
MIKRKPVDEGQKWKLDSNINNFAEEIAGHLGIKYKKERLEEYLDRVSSMGEFKNPKK